MATVHEANDRDQPASGLGQSSSGLWEYEPEVTAHLLAADETFPNNGQYPLLVYRGAFELGSDPAGEIQRTFACHGWTAAWRDGVYDFDHYHSTAHEVLGCYRGWARVRFGGPLGVEVDLQAGDAVVIPAGVAHKCCRASEDFAVIGAYAQGREYDMNRGEDDERPQADQNIADVPRPEQDPIYGESGPLMRRW